jgi:hypothetical protein
MYLRKERYGNIVQHFNFNMPFFWNKDEYAYIDKKTGITKIGSKWSHVESLHKEIEVESSWRDYFASIGDNKQSNKSYHRAQALKKKLFEVIQIEKEKLSQQYIKK